ncbi:M4 family metallopeptidase [Caenimonas koreensis]|uniref:Neutral metalloproteinase n=1 Tax=Caenimonas koreensis DSM 17982 TaxID=1121255 RepID=A0A844B8N6_9BURK|nr:M4 family metallopeptidase [Caenimonas koreensis]MRD49513.1 peptidase M4 family protein [Caenimonas koreensis DSM 17982]
MKRMSGCVCFAVPRKLIQHLADQSDDEGRALLQAQIKHSTGLRGQRSGLSAAAAHPEPATQPLQRRVYDAQGRTLLPGTLLRDEDDAPTRDAQANQAYDNIGIALQFFKSVMGRDSADGRGMRIDTSVHYGFRFANAMWTGEQMIVGDGDGAHFKGMAHSLGIIAHEFSHGVTQHLVKGGLGVVWPSGMPPTLKGEAGSLNESFSDVFASMIKQWHKGQTVDQADWVIGEDIFAPGVGKAVRSLKAPGNRQATWAQDDQISDYRRFSPTDDAHKASGIPNHAFYVAAMALGGKSWETLGQTWLKGFDKLRARSTFLDAAHATVDVAAALHGKGSKAHDAVKAGWKAVNVMV